MKMVLTIVCLLLGDAAYAQQAPPHLTTTEQLISTYSGINVELAKQLDSANQRIADLQTQLQTVMKSKADEAKKPDGNAGIQ